MGDLFGPQEETEEEVFPLDPEAPLADRMRPRSLDEFVGQEDLLKPGSFLRRAIESDTLDSIILWGPPGSGKTSLAAVIAHSTGRKFVPFSAVTSGVREVKAIIGQARTRKKQQSRGTILFVDEIHRFNKAQQDAFLPHVEGGTVTLIGATTENPSFEVIGALLSRTRVFVLKKLQPEHIQALLQRALEMPERGIAHLKPKVDEDVLEYIASYSEGDARVALTVLESSVKTADAQKDGARHVDLTQVQDVLQRKTLLYDKAGEEHYNLISALHKALRGSDAQGALYWMTRMLDAGEHPLYIARRMVRFAVEDVGLADPQAITVALDAKDAVHFLGLPEGDLALAQAAVYLAACPKSNRLYKAMGKVRRDIREHPAAPVPLHIRNAPTRLMSELGYGKDYQYDHDFEAAVAGQEYLPEELKGRIYYDPGEYGFEKEMQKRLEYWERLRRKAMQRNRQSREEKGQTGRNGEDTSSS